MVATAQVLAFRFVLKFGPLLLALCACAEPPKWVLQEGVGVLTSGGVDEAWLNQLFADIKAETPDDDLAHWDRLDGATLEIVPLATVETTCGPGRVGCTVNSSIMVADLPCLDFNQNTAGVIAHEVGHVLGHDNTHLYRPWYGNLGDPNRVGPVVGGLEPIFIAWQCAR